MRQVTVHRDITAPAHVLWQLLVDPARWPDWRPSVRGVRLHDGAMQLGSTGVVTTVLAIDLPFEVTEFEPDVRWAWKVAGVPATDHTVEPLGADSCRVGFGVPIIAAPYVAVCRSALRRLELLATSGTRAQQAPAGSHGPTDGARPMAFDR